MIRDDDFDLARFMSAQEPVFDQAVAELRGGRKRSHWMWFIFPQLRALGRSSTAQFYGIVSLAEARAYLDHAVLGPRLARAVEAVMDSGAPSLHTLFGSPDDLKFASSMTLFEAAAPGPGQAFGQALDRWCGGQRDARTLALIGPGAATGHF